jgi:hypothetical protein
MRGRDESIDESIDESSMIRSPPLEQTTRWLPGSVFDHSVSSRGSARASS